MLKSIHEYYSEDQIRIAKNNLKKTSYGIFAAKLSHPHNVELAAEMLRDGELDDFPIKQYAAERVLIRRAIERMGVR